MAGALARLLIIESGAAETRAVLFVGDEPVRFWFGPARGDERLPRPPQTGAVVAGRVEAVSKPLSGAFVDINADRAAFAPFVKGAAPLVEGALLIAKIRRPPIGGKGAVLSLDWRSGLSPAAQQAIEAKAQSQMRGALGEPADAAIDAANYFADDFRQKALQCIVNDQTTKRVLERAFGVGPAFEDTPLAARGTDDMLEASFDREVGLANGGRLIFHETEAGALVDVDAAGAAGASAGAINDRINAAAVARLFPEMSRRAISGRVIIDFLPPAGADARRKLADDLKASLATIRNARFGKLAPDGLCDFTLPRLDLSLLERATEPAGAPQPVEGRRYTIDWAAKSAVRALENHLARRPTGRPRLVVAPQIAAYLENERSQWRDRLAQRFGARFAIAPDMSKGRGDHEIVE